MKTISKNKNTRDVRNHPKYNELLKKLPTMSFRPLIGIYDLEEVVKIFNNLPEIKFPINSAGELIDKLQKSERSIEYENIIVDPLRMIKYMPAYYFPISDICNFIEKIAELIKNNRNISDVPKELENIRREIYGILQFPIKSPSALSTQLKASKNKFTYRGKNLDIDQIIERVPKELYPFESEQDFFIKIRNLLLNKPLIEPH